MWKSLTTIPFPRAWTAGVVISSESRPLPVLPSLNTIRRACWFIAEQVGVSSIPTSEVRFSAVEFCIS